MNKLKLLHIIQSKNILWYYDTSVLEDIPDNVLIEQTLRWGDVPEINLLFDIYDKDKIRKVWEERLIPDKRIYSHNWYLARIFFDIKEPKNYITNLQLLNSRYERLRKFAK